MTITETNLLHNKAKTRKDGVYSFKGYLWAVKGESFVAFADHLGYCHQRMGSFNVGIGKVERYDRKKALMEFIKKD